MGHKDVDDLAQRMRNLPLPDRLEERLVQAARQDAARIAARRSRERRRRIVVLALAAMALAGGGTALALRVLDLGGSGTTVPAGPEARAAISESGVLARAPWLVQGRGAPRIDEVDPLPSLIQPPGTSYREALTALLGSVISTGTLPEGTRLGEPLADGVVWDVSRPARGPALDLRAPWGFTVPGGAVRGPDFSVRSTLPASEASALLRALREGRPTGRPLPAGFAAGVPPLAGCQVLRRGGVHRPCRLEPPATGWAGAR
jgi:hypothetical protein